MSRKLNTLKQKNPIQTRISVESENEEKIQLLLYGDIGQYYSWSGISLDGVVSALAGKSADTIEVFINSYGGDMFESIAIKNYLIRRPEKIITYVDGIAASGGSLIAMAGDEIIMPKDAQLMIHNPWTIAAGNADDFRKLADEMDKANTSIQETYLTHFNDSREKLGELLAAESWLTAEEALACGLATSVIDAVEPAAPPAVPNQPTDPPLENKSNRIVAFLNL
nr:head maturation protease, ClpP-related [uncultured Trichococcus sp.]